MYLKEMTELAKFAVPGKYYDSKKAEEYYKLQKLYWEKKNRAATGSVAGEKVSKTFINGFGEATTRDITNQTYKNGQKRLSKEILDFIN